jgi:hypothetical protein
MSIEISELDQMQQEYKAAVDDWVKAIRVEEALASGDHSIAEVDLWEQADFSEEAFRAKVKTAKKKYEAALRLKFFNF